MNSVELISQSKKVSEWKKGLHKKTRQLLTGVSDTSKTLMIAAAFEEVGEKLVVITANQNETEKLTGDLSAVVGSEYIYNFFTDDSPIAEFAFTSIDKNQSRVEALEFLLNTEKKGILVTNIATFRIALPDSQIFKKAFLTLKIASEMDIDNIVKLLVQTGYKKTSRVLAQGEFSRRGDILDIYDIASEFPYRIEFFGDEIDGIRLIDPEKQVSLQNIDTASISPASEMIFLTDDFERAAVHFEKNIQKSQDELQKSYLQEVLADIRNQYRHPDIQKFRSLFYEKEWTLIDYISETTPIFFNDFHKLMDSYAFYEKEAMDFLTQDLQKHQTLSIARYCADSYSLLTSHKPAVFLSNFQKGLGNFKFDAIHSFNQHSMQEFFNQISLLKDEIRRYEKLQYTVVLQTESESSLQRLQKTLQDYQLDIPFVEPEKLEVGRTQITFGHLARGFHSLDDKLVWITEHEIFHKKIKRKIRRKASTNAERLKNYSELETGDYVVHHIHGIGQFLGIETIEIKGIHRDYLTVQYQDSGRISLPIEQIDLLSKYTSSDGKKPKLNKLNDGSFKRTKQKVAKQVEDIADDLIQLYAERSQLKGFAFSADDANQEDFDNVFTYVETEDQLRSIKEVKQDMEKPIPMDRLLVGDVGFGKTEVAMRAAFKAVNDGKQVAILVPTTVLAQQHYNSFLARFADFPVVIDVLSRFRSKSEQENTLEKLKKRQVDILIGTHRILSKDVIFADLGLLVIDEEQRFGVKHKEKLKELKNKIDVLTLTATPIPRTLHMSMLGIRDLSIIETPPTNRYPVQTYVLETNPSVIRDAILREIDRDGQVYYLYNKVDTIEQKVSELKELVPEVSIAYIHGQMSEIQIENTLYAFVEGEYDVLVTTTIIETGVDIPNANTLFIENADHMGLSTLYQLRGRVGRSNRIAYAYLMYRPDKSLTEVSEKRLEAIKGFTELGSGFKIAMQDLSIRGAGNILGAAQSGFIDSVGYELYSQLLEEAILKKQGKEKQREKSNTEISLQIDAYIPSEYITDERQKIEIYKKIKEVDSRDNYHSLQEELVDRFGDYPDVVAYLLEISLLKAFSSIVFIEMIKRATHQITVIFEEKSRHYFLMQDYFQALSSTKLKAGISELDGKVHIVFDVRNYKDFEILEELIQFSQKMMAIKETK